MKGGVLVSILMPSYNAAPYIQQAIDSILFQTYRDFELLIIDDKSTDDTAAIVKSFHDERIIFSQNETNQGYLKTCNLLFQQAKGEFIAFQDADDWSFPQRIEKQVNEFVLDNTLGLCATRSKTEVTIDKVVIDSMFVSSTTELENYIEKTGLLPFTGATIMIRRSVWENIGSYRLYFDRLGAEHIDWAYMIYEKYKCKVLNESLYYYRFNPLSFTKAGNNLIEKRKSLEIARFLHIQRKKNGFDDLQSEYKNELNAFIAKLKKPYDLDNSLIYRENSIDLLNKRIYAESLRQICIAFLVAPLRFLNWKIVGVVLVRSFLGFVRKFSRVISS